MVVECLAELAALAALRIKFVFRNKIVRNPHFSTA